MAAGCRYHELRRARAACDRDGNFFVRNTVRVATSGGSALERASASRMHISLELAHGCVCSLVVRRIATVATHVAIVSTLAAPQNCCVHVAVCAYFVLHWWSLVLCAVHDSHRVQWRVNACKLELLSRQALELPRQLPLSTTDWRLQLLAPVRSVFVRTSSRAQAHYLNA